MIDRVVKYGRAQRVELVCAVLHGPTTIRIARAVAGAPGVPLVTIVGDTSGDYRTEGVIINHGPRRASVPARSAAAGEPIVIGFAGSMYARVEWDALLAALDRNRWRIAGRDVIVRVLGSHLEQRASGPLRVEFLGWRDAFETIELLSQMDVAYLPYWFDGAYREAVELSFPSKLSTYVAARLPILYHGPRDSSPTLFLAKYPVGAVCHSLAADDIIATLERLVDPETSRRARVACDEAFDEELSAPVFRRRFAELIGVSESALLPVETLDSPSEGAMAQRRWA